MITVDVRAPRPHRLWSPNGTGVDHNERISRSDDCGRFDRGARTLPWLLRELDHAGVNVRAADVQVPTLDDVFLSLTGRSLREEEVAS
jgi:ABC-2 type transport system ATP-binding protein